MQRSITKYRVGLAMIGLLTLAVFCLVIVQAGGAKQDARTQAAANKIADKLNNYIDNNQQVPLSLAAAGIKNVPTTITYHKKNNDVYIFCATYRQASNLSASGTLESVLNGGSSLDTGDSSDGDTSLFIDSSYHKGANCQTINTGVTAANNTTNSNSSTNTQATTQPAYVKNSDNSYTVCGVRAYFDTEGHITDDTTTPGRMWIESTYYPVPGSNILSVFSPTSQVFDENCKPLTESDLHTGDDVDLFSTVTTAPPSSSIYLKLAQ